MNPQASLRLTQLESHLWEAANILRGPVDAADFKTYVFPLLFFKRISDVHDDEYDAALSESGSAPDQIDGASERTHGARAAAGQPKHRSNRARRRKVPRKESTHRSGSHLARVYG